MRRLTVASVHFSHEGGTQRREHMAALRVAPAAVVGARIVLAGDFNFAAGDVGQDVARRRSAAGGGRTEERMSGLFPSDVGGL